MYDRVNQLQGFKRVEVIPFGNTKHHRQSDVKQFTSPNSIIQYIIKHDEAKKIIAIDYRNLPRNTKKEKKYYEIARKRDHRQKHRRLQ